ncbi:MAG: hypothetical protein QXS92_04645, partial [Thermofilum sp.]
MRVSELTEYIVRHYFSNRRERRYGLLILGPPGIGKSMCVEEAGRRIAKRLNREFLKVVVRWSPRLGKFVLNTEGEREVESVLREEGRYFVFTDFRLSTVEPSDLSGVPRSRDGITYYDPLLWAVLHSANPGILFLRKQFALLKGLFSKQADNICFHGISHDIVSLLDPSFLVTW